MIRCDEEFVKRGGICQLNNGTVVAMNENLTPDKDVVNSVEGLATNNEYVQLFFDIDALPGDTWKDLDRLRRQDIDFTLVYVAQALSEAVGSGTEMSHAVGRALSEGIAAAQRDISVARSQIERTNQVTLPPKLLEAVIISREKKNKKKFASAEEEINELYSLVMSSSGILQNYMMDNRDSIRAVVLASLIQNGALGAEARQQIAQLDSASAIANDAKFSRQPQPEQPVSVPRKTSLLSFASLRDRFRGKS